MRELFTWPRIAGCLMLPLLFLFTISWLGTRAQVAADDTDPDWQGTFRRSEGLRSSQLTVDAQEFVLTGRTNQKGTVSHKDGTLTLTSTTSKVTETKRFHVFRWAKRVYLVKPEEVLFFCNAVNSGDEPVHAGEGGFYCSIGSPRPQIGDQLKGPVDISRYILQRPVSGEIYDLVQSRANTHVPGLEADFVGYRAKLRVGRKDGAFDGMQLHFSAEAAIVDCYIMKADDAASDVLIVPHVCPGERPLCVQTGDRASSRRDDQQK